MGVLALASLQSCASWFGVRLPSDGEVLESISPVKERDTVGAYITWRITDTDPSDSDDVEETEAYVADHGDTHVVEERVTQRNGTTIVTARVFGKDGRLLAVYRGAPNELGKPLSIIKLDQLADRVINSNPEAKKALGGIDVESVAKNAMKTMLSQGEQLETVEVPAGSFQCIRSVMAMRVLWVKYTDTFWHARQPLPLSDLVKFVSKCSMDEGQRTRELLRYAWSGAKPTLRLPDLSAGNGFRQ